jgi:hypothetical protein
MVAAKPAQIASMKKVALPQAYYEAKDLNLVNLHSWHLLSDQEFDYLFQGVNKRYPQRDVIPFARRADNDDVAVFVVSDREQQPGQILVIHDFAGAGSEVVARIKSFWDWFRYAVDEMIEWHDSDRVEYPERA